MIGSRPTLVVVDNCEHVVAATAQLVEALLESAPGLYVLATSRDPLRIAAETVWRVPPMKLPPPGAGAAKARGSEAVALFLARARSANPQLSLDDATVISAAEIARRLDGLPLAIELASARVAVLEPSAIVEALYERFNLLTSGARTAPARHRTLRAALDWSYELLPPAEQDLFCRLSVFPGTFSLNAAVAVAGAASAAATDLFRLVSESIVYVARNAGRQTRYRLLETLRQFGADPIEAATLEEARMPTPGTTSPWCRPKATTQGCQPHQMDDLFSSASSTTSGRCCPICPNDQSGAATCCAPLAPCAGTSVPTIAGARVSASSRAPSPAPAQMMTPRLIAKVLGAVAYVAAGIDADKCARYAHAASEAALQLGDSRTATLAKAVLARGLDWLLSPTRARARRPSAWHAKPGTLKPSARGCQPWPFRFGPTAPMPAPGRSRFWRSSSP